MAEKKVLDGVKPVRGDSTFIGTLHPVLKAAGADWSMPRLTGTFGHAFSFSMKIGTARSGNRQTLIRGCCGI